ncbi:MAG: hypothetical protein AAF466_12480 [Bacteroidota bacterium]
MNARIERIDHRIKKLMNRWGVPALRISFAIIFFWFGILKPLGISPAIPLVKNTVEWLPMLSPDTWVHVIGWWEVAIGVLFLFRKATPLAVTLLFLQMIGTLMPLVFLPKVVYQDGNFFALTMEGQYIIKNVMIISAALVVGGSSNNKSRNHE